MTLQFLTAPGCHICEEVRKILKEIKIDFPDLEIEEIDMTTPRGQELVQRHSIMVSPGIIIEGELFSSGGVDKEKLINKLRSLSEA